jgi:hypothetical protein
MTTRSRPRSCRVSFCAATEKSTGRG